MSSQGGREEEEDKSQVTSSVAALLCLRLTDSELGTEEHSAATAVEVTEVA